MPGCGEMATDALAELGTLRCPGHGAALAELGLRRMGLSQEPEDPKFLVGEKL